MFIWETLVKNLSYVVIQKSF